MRVLLTGATGFLGQSVARKLREVGVDTVTIGRRHPSDNQEHIQADLLNTEDHSSLVNQAGASHLIHLAWYAEHGKYWSSPLNIDWIKATVSLVKAFCESGGQHITISGTCAEYDWSYGYCTEDITPTNPKTVYGSCKDTTRIICQDICFEYDVPLAWGRVFFPFGKGEPETRLFPSLAAVFRNDRPKFGVNSDSYRDLLHVSDAANALVTLSTKQATGCVNISSGEAVRIRDVVSTMAQLMSSEFTEILNMAPVRTAEPIFLVGNNDRLKNLGWHKTISLVDGLKDFL
jgi:nucleoside-diphosphate-sugar epimerase